MCILVNKNDYNPAFHILDLIIQITNISFLLNKEYVCIFFFCRLLYILGRLLYIAAFCLIVYI